MARSEWKVIINGTDRSSIVLNASFDVGRQSFLDDFATNYATVTARNNLGQFDSMTPGQLCRFEHVTSSKVFPFWLESISYNDGIDADTSTATLVFSDVMGRLSKALGSSNTPPLSNYNGMQLLSDVFTNAFIYGQYAPPPDLLTPTTNYTNHQQYDIQGDKSLAEIVNIVLKNEGGGFYTQYVNPTTIWFYPWTQDMIYRNVAGFTFGNAPSASMLVWDQMTRSNFGDLFANTVSLSYQRTDLGTAPGPYKNSTSVSAYGIYNTTFDNFNNTFNSGDPFNPFFGIGDPQPAQALGDWFATVLSDTNIQTYQIRISDFAQNNTAMSTFDSAIETLAVSMTSLTYNKPIVGLVTERVKVEGYTVTIEPDVTYYDIYFSPITIYSQLTLGLTEQGKLDTYRLGY